jgi:hypothetical protein
MVRPIISILQFSEGRYSCSGEYFTFQLSVKILNVDQEHIVQWHPTILSKLGLIPQRIMNAYSKEDAAGDGTYKDGDLVIRFAGCDKVGRDCAAEAEPFSKQWKTAFRVQ